MRFDRLSVLLGTALFSVKYALGAAWNVETTMAVNAVGVWLFIFGLTGLFLRYGSAPSPRMRYMADSSYWIYLFHLSWTALIPGWIAHWPLPAWGKFIVVLLLTTGICMAS